MNYKKTLDQALSVERQKIDKLMYIILLAHLPFTLFLAPWGYETHTFAAVSSILLAVLVSVGYFLNKGTRGFSIIVAIAFMLNSAILIQSQLGRIEMHFHIFVALAFLLAYRDALPVIAAAAVGAVHHIVLTYLQLNSVTLADMPIMVFNYGCSWDITFLHAFFVVVEAGVLIYLAERMRKEFATNAFVAASLQEVAQTNRYRLDLSDLKQTDDTIEALKALMNSTDQAMSEIAQVMNRVAKGDFTARIQRDYQGDLAGIKQGVNAAVDQLQLTMQSLSLVMDGLSKGQFEVRMDAKIEGEARKKVDQAMELIANQLNQIANLAQSMQKGDFSQRMTGKAPGLLGQVSDGLNQSLNQVQQAFEAIQQASERLAQGDLTQSIQQNMDGELNSVKAAINHAIVSLSELVGTIVQTSVWIQADAEKVQEFAQDLAQRTQKQSASLQQAAASMEQMTESVKQNTSVFQQVNELSNQSNQTVSLGIGRMQGLNQAMQKVNDSSQHIVNIVGLIDSIAFQTNLLALNAAVEAARAGEAGRGFAVVAGEVRVLAQKSADAAKDIRALIDQTAERISGSLQLVNDSSESFNEIEKGIRQVGSRMAQVVSSSQQEYQGIVQVNRAVANMDKDTQQMRALVEEAHQAAETLVDQAKNLADSVERFKVNSTRALPKAN